MKILNIVDVPLTGQFVRIVVSVVLIVVYYREFEIQGLPTIVVCLTVLVYLTLLWIRLKWWSEKKYIWISMSILSVSFTLHFADPAIHSVLLWPLVYLLALSIREHGRLTTILASITIASIIFLSYTSVFPLASLLAFAGLFVGIRSRRIRQDAYGISQYHLQELDEAHKKLQEVYVDLQKATVYSIRYAALEERTRLAREIHDGLGHQLTSIIIQLQALEIMLPDDPQRAVERVAQLLPLSRKAMAEVRMAVKEWSEDEMGLGLVALKGLVSQIQGGSSIKFHFVHDLNISEWSIETSIVLYRVLQESLTNVLRHSNATSVDVRIKETDDRIVLTVSDDGHYSEDERLTPGFGLKGILERCRSLGGTCTFTQERPHGFRIVAAIPIASALSHEMEGGACSGG